MTQPLIVPTSDGRELEVLLAGPDDGFPFVFHHGTPQGAVPNPDLEQTAADLGLRTIAYSRPGYGASTARSAIGRIADDAHDTAAILDHLGVGEFVTLGWSGGGPRALACAAVLPGRCLAAASGVGVAPYLGFEGDYLGGMGEENLIEFGAALEGEAALRALLEEWRPSFGGLTAANVVEGMGDLLPDVDRAFLTDQVAEVMAHSMRHALSRGIEGWLHDDMMFLTSWGFDLATIDVPVALWQGRADRMVPFAHAEWLAEHVAGAQAHYSQTDGHLSLLARMPEILSDLKERAGLK